MGRRVASPNIWPPGLMHYMDSENSARAICINDINFGSGTKSVSQNVHSKAYGMHVMWFHLISVHSGLR